MSPIVEHRPPCDAVVVGGGPAGATAARLLRLWGHRVTLLTRERPARLALAETLPPSCRRLFRHLEIAEAVDAAEFQRSTGNTVWWGGQTARAERFAGEETGYQVSSLELERLLLRLAGAAGVDLRREVTVRSIRGLEEGRTRPDAVADESETLAVDLEGASDANTVRAHWVLDASGRSGVLARRWRRRVAGVATLALIARFESESWELEDASHTLVESYGDGWAWSVPLSARRRFVAVMVDPKRTDLASVPDREALFQAELNKTRGLRRVFARACQSGPTQACDASSYTSETFCGRGFFLLGDAASSIDPLSSYGVKKAMTSGWLAAVCVHTALRRREMASHALDLYRQRERQVFASYSRFSALYAKAAAGENGSDFWRERVRAESMAADYGSGEIDAGGLRGDPALEACFAELRRSETLKVRRSRRVKVEPRPLVVGREVTLADHLVFPAAPGGIRFLRGVDLTRLVALAPTTASVPDLLAAYERGGSAASPPDLLGALAFCLSREVLVPRTALESRRRPG